MSRTHCHTMYTAVVEARETTRLSVAHSSLGTWSVMVDVVGACGGGEATTFVHVVMGVYAYLFRTKVKQDMTSLLVSRYGIMLHDHRSIHRKGEGTHMNKLFRRRACNPGASFLWVAGPSL